MTVHGVIYRLTGATDTENTAGIQKVEFGDDKHAIITGYHFHLSRKYTDNGSPGLDTARKPDTGFKVGTITINCRFFLDNTNNDDTRIIPPQLAQLRDWVTSKNVTNNYLEGRFGLRFDLIPTVNTKPIKESGFKISSFDFDWTGQMQTVADGVIVLEFSGDGNRIGTTT